jgi:acetylornithine deacetylase/succinyl-diaminopimelate desuccinylase-like protein
MDFSLSPLLKRLTFIQRAIFARGACDDKGQMYMHVKAFEYMIQNTTCLCNVKFMIEGEEEVEVSTLKHL